MKIELIDKTNSTNEYIKQYIEDGQDVLVCSRIQTGGRGTKGRSFSSTEGGVYLSALRFFSQLSNKDAFRLLQHAAVAVCLTVESFGVKPCIKWANDVLVNGRKIAGILIENTFSGSFIKNSVVGIGLNVCNDLGELNDIAINLSEAAGRAIRTEEARDRLIKYFCETGLIESEKEYGRRLLLGKVKVIEGDKSFSAVAKRVLEDGRLEVETDGGVRLLSAAEVSIR